MGCHAMNSIFPKTKGFCSTRCELRETNTKRKSASSMYTNSSLLSAAYWLWIVNLVSVIAQISVWCLLLFQYTDAFENGSLLECLTVDLMTNPPCWQSRSVLNWCDFFYYWIIHQLQFNDFGLWGQFALN